MVHRKILLIGMVVLALTMIHCEEQLEIDPAGAIETDTALSSEENILNLLIGVYNEAQENSLFDGNSQIIADLLGSSFEEVLWNGTFGEPIEFLLKEITVGNFSVEDHWGGAYELINQANIVLDNLDIIISSEETRNRVEGEARFLRALAYFDLVRLYGLPYEAAGNNQQVGVPINSQGNVDFTSLEFLARSSVQEAYDLIVSDLTRASDILPANNDVFADAYAARGLLARVYLQMGNYEVARDLADEVLNNSGHILEPDFASAFNNDVDSDETVFAIQKTEQDNISYLIDLYASQANGGRGGDIAVEPGYLALFDDPINDVRASFFYESPDNGLLLTSKYTNIYGNISLIRVAEMHLIRSECNFRLGTSVGLAPLDEINALRARSNATPLTGLDLDLILNERRLELGFEGFLIHDIKRTQGDVAGLAFDDPSLVLPIPQTEMDSNPLMVQNPGYGN